MHKDQHSKQYVNTVRRLRPRKNKSIKNNLSQDVESVFEKKTTKKHKHTKKPVISSQKPRNYTISSISNHKVKFNEISLHKVDYKHLNLNDHTNLLPLTRTISGPTQKQKRALPTLIFEKMVTPEYFSIKEKISFCTKSKIDSSKLFQSSLCKCKKPRWGIAISSCTTRGFFKSTNQDGFGALMLHSRCDQQSSYNELKSSKNMKSFWSFDHWRDFRINNTKSTSSSVDETDIEYDDISDISDTSNEDFDFENESNITVSENGENVEFVHEDYQFSDINNDKPHSETCHDTLLCAVTDGHGLLGEIASDIACSDILNNLASSILYKNKTNQNNIEESLLNAFSFANLKILRISEAEEKIVNNIIGSISTQTQKNMKRIDYGTTACICVFHNSFLHIAHVGDTRALLISRDIHNQWTLNQITADHTPSISSETKRILKEGGKIKQTNYGSRVYPADISFETARQECLTLNMTRALGHHILSQCGISAVPTIKTISFQNYNKYLEYFIVIASDGLFDVLSNEEVMHKIIKTPSITKACFHLDISAEKRWKRRGYGDNIAVSILHLIPPSKQL